MKNKTDRAKECQFCSKEHTDWEKECKYWGRPPLKVTECNCNCHCKGGPCKSSHSHYCEHCKPGRIEYEDGCDCCSRQNANSKYHCEHCPLNKGFFGESEDGYIERLKTDRCSIHGDVYPDHKCESKVSECNDFRHKRECEIVTGAECVDCRTTASNFISKKELREFLTNDIEILLDEYCAEWELEGRSEDQIYGVKNFITGKGKKIVKELKDKLDL